MTSFVTRVANGTLVAAGLTTMNLAIYVFLVVAARLLAPAELGALTALLGIVLMGNVVALGVQAATARRLAMAPERRRDIVAAARRVALASSLAVGGALTLAAPVLAPALKLDSMWPVVLCGATVVPLTLMGAAAGVAQGRSCWVALTAIHLGNGAGRMIGGVVAILVEPTATSAMAGVALGTWLPVMIGAPLLRGRAAAASWRSLLRESALAAHALLAYFALSSLDAILARMLFDRHDSGLYASGLILAKAAMFTPQFVSVLLFPDLARASTARTRLRAVAVVAALGALATGAAALLPRLALVLVGGPQYEEIAGRLWLFAWAGSALALVHLLVLDALARRAHAVVLLVWAAVATLVLVAVVGDLGITGLVVTVGTIATALVAILVLRPARPGGQ